MVVVVLECPFPEKRRRKKQRLWNENARYLLPWDRSSLKYKLVRWYIHIDSVYDEF